MGRFGTKFLWWDCGGWSLTEGSLYFRMLVVIIRISRLNLQY